MSRFPLRQSILLALSIAGAASAQPSPSQIVVNVWSFGFGPRPIHLHAGQPVTLTFTNRSGSGHDFTAREFFASSRILAGAAPDGEIELSGHQTRSITLIPRPGTYRAHCSHFFHAQMGMTDSIVVD
jgi:plastocyanin